MLVQANANILTWINLNTGDGPPEQAAKTIGTIDEYQCINAKFSVKFSKMPGWFRLESEMQGNDQMAKKSKEVAPKEESRTPEEVWHPLTSLRDEFDDLFERFSTNWPMMGPFGRGGTGSPMRRMREVWGTASPAVDIVDKADAMEVRAELPGMAEADIDVEVSDSMLTISGEKKEEREEGEKGSRHYLSERRYGSFARSFRLPEGVDQDKMSAKFANGVLVVTMPKSPEARQKAKKIAVKKG